MTTSGDTNLHTTGSSAAGKSMPASSPEIANIVSIAITVIAPSELIAVSVKRWSPPAARPP